MQSRASNELIIMFIILILFKQRIVNFLNFSRKIYYLCNMELSITPEFILAVTVLLGAVREIASSSLDFLDYKSLKLEVNMNCNPKNQMRNST